MLLEGKGRSGIWENRVIETDRMAVPCWRAGVVRRGLDNGSSSDDGVEDQEKKPERAQVITPPTYNATASTITSLIMTGGEKGPANVRYSMRFQPTSVLIPNIGIFSAILELLLFLATSDRY